MNAILWTLINNRRFNVLNRDNLKTVIQSGGGSGYISDMTRKLSFGISLICIRLKIHSNTVTAASLFFAVFGAILQSFNDLKYLHLSIVFILLYNILDHVDGELARYEKVINKEKKGLDGPYFDSLVHYIFTPLLFFSIGLAFYKNDGSELSLWCGLIVGMWLSTYGSSASYRILMDFIFHEGDNNKTLKKIKPIWKHNKNQKNNISFKKKFFSLIRESFSTIGQIYLLTGLHLINLIFSIPFQLRFYYLYLMGLIAIFNIPRVCFKYFKLLKKIK